MAVLMLNCTMESAGDGVSSLSKTHNSASVVGYKPSAISGPTRLPSPKQCGNEEASSASYAMVPDHGMKTVHHPVDSVINEKHSHKTVQDNMHLEEVHTSSEQLYKLNEDQLVVGPNDGLDKMVKSSSQEQVSAVVTKSCIKHSVDVSENCNSNGSLGHENFVPGPCTGGVVELNGQLTAQPAITFCGSSQNSLYSATHYTEAKQSFTNTEVSECASSVEKSGESAEISNSCDFAESRKTSIYRESTGSDISDESSSSSFSGTLYKPHKANDTRWEAIQAVRSRDGLLGVNHFRLLKKLGCGDIGTVYLSELSCTRSYFAMKVMDKAALAGRKKLLRAQTEREILQSLDHPFLPTLYTHFETEKFSCLVMEFCPGGDLHALRQRQPGKYFSEHAARSVFLFCPSPLNSYAHIKMT